MFEKKQKFSYTEQRTENIKKLIVLLGISVFFLVHLVLTTFIITTREIRNTAMMPGIAPGERVVFLSFGIRELFPNFPLTKHLPVRRGDVVLVNIKVKTKHNILVFFAVH
jgi:signal peptidase I